MWVVYMQCECVAAALVVGVLFMWVVYTQYECVVAALVGGALFMWGCVSAYMYMQYECAVATQVVGDGRCRRSNCTGKTQFSLRRFRFVSYMRHCCPCLLYTSDAADE